MDNDNLNDSSKSKLVSNKKVFISLLLILAVVVIGTSFALWQLTFTQSGANVITTGCLKLTLTEETDAINLVDATPTSDEEGKKLEPFTFTLENVCTTEADYVVNLETLSTGDKILADSYVKASLVSGENELFIDNLLETHINEEKVIEEATIAYRLHQGKLGNKEKISFNLRLWMDEATEAVDEVMNATWQGKITVTATYVPPIEVGTSNMMIAMDMLYPYEWEKEGGANYKYVNNTYSQDENYIIYKMAFEDVLNPHEGALEVVDFSETQDKSILGYYVKNDGRDDISLYIQANGKIMANENASGYFISDIWCKYDLCENQSLMGIEGIENIDTSLVTSMDYMFMGYSGSMLNLDNFNMSNVTTMKSMFNACSNLTTTINITNPNVENYDDMFLYAATEEGAQITVNYTAETSDLVDRMIATKSENSNVVKGSLIS